MEFIVFSLIAVGAVLFVVCMILLIAPFVGWSCKYNTSVTEKIAHIPRAGRYAINIRYNRGILGAKLQGHAISAVFDPKVSFSVQRIETGEEVKCHPRHRLFTSKSGNRLTVLVGYFDALGPGEHLVTSLAESNFAPDTKVIIRKHVSAIRVALVTLGICVGTPMAFAGLFLGLYHGIF